MLLKRHPCNDHFNNTLSHMDPSSKWCGERETLKQESQRFFLILECLARREVLLLAFNYNLHNIIIEEDFLMVM